MQKVLEILYIIVGLFFILSLEAFFGSFLGFKIIFLVLLFAYKKIDWKKLFLFILVISLVMDVTMHYKLGTNLLLFTIPLGLFAFFSLFSSVEDGIGSYVVRFFAIFLYYILNLILPELLILGNLGHIDMRAVLVSLTKVVVSILLLFLINYVIGGMRKRGSTSQIRLK